MIISRKVHLRDRVMANEAKRVFLVEDNNFA